MEAAQNVNSHTYYLNLIKAKQKAESNPMQTPYTPTISSIYGFLEALRIIDEDGLENTIKRHMKAAKASRAASKALGLNLFAKREEIASNTVTTLKVPDEVGAGEIRNTMLGDYNVEIAGGQDRLNGKVIRIGHMGNISYKELAVTYTALGATLKKLGLDVMKL